MRLSKYIVEYKEYKENLGRGKGITMEEAIKMAPKFSDAIESDTVITRASRTADQHEYYLIDPKKSKQKRVSYNTYNYYTLIMDNSSAWKKYPKRSESVIASMNKKCGIKYPMRVLPKNGSRIGICSNVDLWFSFENSFDMNMDRVNNTLDDLFGFTIDSIKRFDKDLKTIKSACKIFDTWYKNEKNVKDWFERRFSSRFGLSNVEELLKGYKGDLYKMIESKLNPEYNNFKVIKTSSLNSVPIYGDDIREVWTDAESLMVRCDEWWKFYKEV